MDLGCRGFLNILWSNIKWTWSVEQEYYEACTGVILYQLLVHLFWLYNVNKVEFPINSDKGEVRMDDIKAFEPLWAYQTTETSKVVSYTLAQLIWW